MAFVYGIDAKKRVSQLGFKEISTFLEEVPTRHREAAFSGVRPIPGFRKNEPAELKKRIEKLATSLAHAFASPHRATERDWNALGEVWNGWGQFTFEGRISEAFKRFRTEQCSFQSFLRNIVGDDDDIDIATEDVKRIFLFSPFDSMNEAEEILSAVPSKRELEKSRKIAKIPADLAELKRNISSIISDVEKLKSSIGSANSSDADASRAEIRTLKVEIENFGKRCLLIEEHGVSQLNALHQATDISHRANEAMLKKIAANEARLSTLEKTCAEVSSTIKTMEGVLKSMQKTMAEQLKERGSSKAGDIDHKASTGSTFAHVAHIEIDRIPSGEPLVKVAGPGELLNALLNNYVAIGVAESSARRIAIAVAVAVMNGQLVQFCGSFADTVANATLWAVGGESSMAWNVPAGLCDGELASSIIRKAVDPKQQVRALLLRGLNKSAFDVYGYEVRNVLINRFLGVGQRQLSLALISTWIDGNACLPERDTLAELGPMIDTDTLTWTKAKGKFTRYSLPSSGWELHADAKSNERSELSNAVLELPLKKSELWRRCVRQAIRGLSAIPNIDDPVVEEVLFMNWVLPWSAIGSGPEFDAGQFFNEHYPAVQDNSNLISALQKYSEIAR